MQYEKMLSVIIMAGGTGGHIFPALAVAEKLQDLGNSVHWIGTYNSMEAEIVPQYGFTMSLIPIVGIRGKKFYELFKMPWLLGLSLFKVLKILMKQKPSLVIGMGGYVTGPGGIAAKMLRIPLVIHEQNAVPGMTNRLLAKMANKVCVGFPGTCFETTVPSNRYLVTGNPLRNAIKPFGIYEVHKPLRVLIIGGSRGAVSINKLIPQVVKSCRGSITVWHQTGEQNIADCRKMYQDCGLSERIEPFIEDMSAAYGWADFVVCRAGALTVSELAAVGKPALFIPYPYAVDNHQTKNGAYLVDRGGAFMVQQCDLNIEWLSSLCLKLVHNPEMLIDMAVVTRQLGQLESTEHFVNVCLGLYAEKSKI